MNIATMAHTETVSATDFLPVIAKAITTTAMIAETMIAGVNVIMTAGTAETAIGTVATMTGIAATIETIEIIETTVGIARGGVSKLIKTNDCSAPLET